MSVNDAKITAWSDNRNYSLIFGDVNKLMVENEERDYIIINFSCPRDVDEKVIAKYCLSG